MFSFTIKTFFLIALIVYMYFDIVPCVETKKQSAAHGIESDELVEALSSALGVELKDESSLHRSNEFVEAASSVAGAPKGYWNLRSWVSYHKFASKFVKCLPGVSTIMVIHPTFT